MRADDAAAAEPVRAQPVAGGLVVHGHLVFATATAALDTLLAALPASGSLAVDLAGVSRSDSAGLAALVEWQAQARRRGVHLRLSGAADDLRALARLSDLDAELFA
jgi:phospholipid transport system transporter-binding protein